MQPHFRVELLFKLEKGFNHLFSNTLAVLGGGQKMILGKIEFSACGDHHGDHVLQHWLQLLNFPAGAGVIQFQGKTIDLVAQ